jgi:hypothetical protein
MGECFISQATLTRHEANKKIVVILSLLRRFYIIPILHYSIIPQGVHKYLALKISSILMNFAPFPSRLIESL